MRTCRLNAILIILFACLFAVSTRAEDSSRALLNLNTAEIEALSLYEILSIDPTVKDEESFRALVKTASRDAWKIYYPILNELDKDKGHPNYKKAELIVKKINDAKDILPDQAKRQKYNYEWQEQQRRAKSTSSANGPQVNRNFQEEMRRRAQAQERQRQSQGEQSPREAALNRQRAIKQVLDFIYTQTGPMDLTASSIADDLQDLKSYRDEILKNPYFEKAFKEEQLKRMLEFLSRKTKLWITARKDQIDLNHLFQIRQEFWKWREVLRGTLSENLFQKLERVLVSESDGIQRELRKHFSKEAQRLKFLDKLNEVADLSEAAIHGAITPIADNFLEDNPLTQDRKIDARQKNLMNLEFALEELFENPNFVWAKPEYKNHVLSAAVKALTQEAKTYVKAGVYRSSDEQPPEAWSQDFLRTLELIRSKRAEFPNQAAALDGLLESIRVHSKEPAIVHAVEFHKRQYPAPKKGFWCDLFKR